MWLPSLPPVLETPLIDMFIFDEFVSASFIKEFRYGPDQSIIVVSALAARRAWRMRNQTQSRISPN